MTSYLEQEPGFICCQVAKNQEKVQTKSISRVTILTEYRSVFSLRLCMYHCVCHASQSLIHTVFFHYHSLRPQI